MPVVVSPVTSRPSTLPPPSTFDILPPLYALLSRLLLPQQSTQTSSTPATSSPALSNTTDGSPLSPKDLTTAASAVKVKIQKAQVAVKALPEVERTIEEQEVEIRELELEADRLGRVLSKLAEGAREAVRSEED